MLKEYNSFEEIDARLEVLKLQRQIDEESFKLHLHKAKRDLVPRQFNSGIGSLLQKFAIAFLTKKLSKRFRERSQKEIAALNKTTSS